MNLTKWQSFFEKFGVSPWFAIIFLKISSPLYQRLKSAQGVVFLLPDRKEIEPMDNCKSALVPQAAVPLSYSRRHLSKNADVLHVPTG